MLLTGVVTYAATERRRSPVVAWLSIIAAAAGLYFTWTPDHATQVAMWAGVGRGVRVRHFTGQALGRAAADRIKATIDGEAVVAGPSMRADALEA